MQNLQNILDKLKKQDQQDYGVAVFDIALKIIGEKFFLSGEVLTENQKDKIFELAKKKKIKIVDEKIKVLSDANKRYELGWIVVKNKVVDLKLRFVSNKILNEKILKRIRCSQAFKGEILRVLYKNEDQFLVQQNDLTLGWVNRGDVILKKKSLLKDWKKGNFAIKGKTVKITDKKDAKKFHSPNGTMEPSEKITKEAEKYLGTKYLLGGKTKQGIDCSGLVQMSYKNFFGIILPKHSWDQKEMGMKVRLKDIRDGDLVFLIKKSNKHRHVGIAQMMSKESAKRFHSPNGTMEPSVVYLIHASLDQKKVVKQNLDEIFENYEFVEVRRIVF